MENDNIGESTVKLVNILIEIVSQWRIMLVAFILGGALCGLVDYTNNRASVNTEQVVTVQKDFQMRINELEETLSEKQLSDVKNIIDYEKMYEEKQRYLQHSELMNADLLRIEAADLVYQVQAQEDKVYNIKQAYKALLGGYGLTEYLDVQRNLDTSYELVTLRAYDDEKEPDNIICLRIKAENEEQCDTVIELVKKFVEKTQNDLQNTLGDHTIKLLSENRCEISDYDLLQSKTSIMSQMISIRDTVANAKTTFSNEQKEYYNIVSGKIELDQDHGEVDDGTAVRTRTVSAKKIVLGSILAGIACACIIFLRYIFETSIKCTDDFYLMYNIVQYDGIDTEKYKKKKSNMLDKWIKAWRQSASATFVNDNVKILANELAKAAQKAELKTIYLICAENVGNITRNVCDDIILELSKKEINMTVMDKSKLWTVEAEQIPKVGIVIAASAGRTSSVELGKFIRKARILELNILGGFIIE